MFPIGDNKEKGNPHKIKIGNEIKVKNSCNCMKSRADPKNRCSECDYQVVGEHLHISVHKTEQCRTHRDQRAHQTKHGTDSCNDS